MLLDVALQARSALARDLGVANPPRFTLRLHPTVESYQRATGQPWYTAGATLDTEIHLVPLTVLRERGVLERTIRHEIVHLLTHDRARDPSAVGPGRNGHLLRGRGCRGRWVGASRGSGREDLVSRRSRAP